MITYHVNTSNELRTNFVEGYCFKDYLSSLFINNDYEYFWSSTKWEDLDKEYTKKSRIENRLGLRYNNILDLVEHHYLKFDGAPSIYFPEGLRFVKIKMPFAKLNFNNWTSSIKQIGIQLYWLNPNIKEEILYFYLYQTVLTYVTFPNNERFLDYRLRHIKGHINESISYYSLICDELSSKVKAITDQILEMPYHDIVPRKNGIINFLNNPDYELSEKELKAFQNKIQGDYKSDLTSSRIQDLIMNWDFLRSGTITKDKLALKLSINRSTVARRWKKYKGLIESLNLQYLKNAA
ncbi:hypothetical protein [Psychroserpens sp.]|uniref:hypothetical protein n=1 Tax=Psychroserpens sp. TaxID=2020870 RepID=UPI001B1CF6CE|nr:hypothetical protein [Psychroserpens sp.]MBO6606720.1 hypothetical protein [Psychroserpens sp.]MBO6653424.1 hypothetical protein [Psychroserpens sp.]MBO6680549.1 hypothetical protein [Psychroserpens sp.]MBO6914975.1 hypothetical protein [Psychroserpens sp.]MBO6942135.1 hypothetical protein [Psychroserpens sp.]